MQAVGNTPSVVSTLYNIGYGKACESAKSKNFWYQPHLLKTFTSGDMKARV